MTSKKSDQLELTPAEIDALRVELGDRLWPAPSDPMAVARRLLTDHSHAGITTLRHWRAGWMRWESTHWIEIEERTIRAEAYRRLEKDAMDRNRSVGARAAELIAAGLESTLLGNAGDRA